MKALYADLEDKKAVIGWYIVYTQPQCEFLVNFDLVCDGFTSYLPLAQTTRNDSKLLVPLFSRYLFVKKDENHAKIHRIKNITQLVAFSDEPIIISEKIIEELRSRECDEYPAYIITDKTSSKGPQYKPHELVRIITGPHEGLKGRFNKQTNKFRADITLQWLGSQRQVNIPLASICRESEVFAPQLRIRQNQPPVY